MNNVKKLGLITLTSLVAGNVIGSGIFILPASLAALGSLSLFSWIITGCAIIMMALIFAKMSHLVPQAGGPYAYAHKGFGDYVGFQTAFCYWLTLWIGNAAVAMAAVGYLGFLLPVLQSPLHRALTAIVIVWVLTIINWFDVRKAGDLQLILTIIKLIPLFVIGIIGWHYFHPTYITHYANLTPDKQSSFALISSATILTLWAFLGIEAATVPADKVTRPQRNIPLATIIGTLLVTAVYIVTSIIIMGMVKAPVLAHSSSPFAEAAALIFGPWGRDAIAIGAIISALGTLNGRVLLQGQLLTAVAHQKHCPALLGKCNRFGANLWGQLTCCILVTILLLMTAQQSFMHQFEFIVLLSGTFYALPYLFTALSLIIVSNHKGNDLLPHKKTYITMALLVSIFLIWAMFSAGPEIIYYIMLIMILGTILYAWMKGMTTRE